MSTRTFIMPPTPEIGSIVNNGRVRMDTAWQGYFGGLQDVSKRVADYVDPTTATAAQIVNALIAAGLMKSE